MIVAALLFGELLVILWLVWCFVRKRQKGEEPSLGLLAYTEERFDPNAKANAAKVDRGARRNA